MAKVTLREVTKETVIKVCKLSLHKHQEQFVAPNSYSFAQSIYDEYAWYRAIYADEEIVGFVMLYDNHDKPDYYLWRFMIDKDHQGKGYGKAAIGLLVEYVKTRPNASELTTSVVPKEGSPQPFYESLGFTFTGEYDEGEAILKLKL